MERLVSQTIPATGAKSSLESADAGFLLLKDGQIADESTFASKNFTKVFREAFEEYVPNTGGKWTQVLGSGDLVFVDGNAAAASYLVVSKDPLSAGGITTIETVDRFGMPLEAAIGAHMSQRTLGQEFSLELVGDETIPAVPDVAISSISQATTTLTINTVTPHGMVPGKRFCVYGVNDPRMNYPALVVASIPSPTQFTATAGPGGTIPSVTAGPFTTGSVRFRSALGFSQNGVSQVFENATVTNASMYVRSESGDASPSGTIAGNHSVTINTTASVQALNLPYTYAFQPTSEYRVSLMADRLQFTDGAVDSSSQTTNRLTRTQVVPAPEHAYKFRVRATNNQSLTVPVAQIVSAAKAGSTTATIIFDRPHGLTVADVIVTYGTRDQTNFANLATATAIASIVNATTITVVWGASVTATTYGGYAARVNGGNLMSALGQGAIVVQSATLTSGILTLTGSGSWSGLLIGDSLNAIGVRNIVDGSTLGIDGAYRVRNVVTTALELERIDGGIMPADFVSTNCGGTVIKRTDLRLSFVRLFDYERLRVETLSRPTSDTASSFPVVLQNTPNIGTVTTVTTVAAVTAVTNAGTPAAPATPYFLNSLASTNGGLIITGSSGLQAFWASNTGAGAAYVKLYNKATAPTVGTDVPEMVIPVPAAVGGVPGVAQVIPGFIGHRFALGLGIAITGGAGDTDTTAVAAGQVKVKLARTV
jgi:hypothetical protein